MLSKINICLGPTCCELCDRSSVASVGASASKLTNFNDRPVWPTQRQHMADAPMIALRMGEDASELIRERGVEAVITIDDLLEQGWTYDQVRRFGDAAMALVKSEIANCSNVA